MNVNVNSWQSQSQSQRQIQVTGEGHKVHTELEPQRHRLAMHSVAACHEVTSSRTCCCKLTCKVHSWELLDYKARQGKGTTQVRTKQEGWPFETGCLVYASSHRNIVC